MYILHIPWVLPAPSHMNHHDVLHIQLGILMNLHLSLSLGGGPHPIYDYITDSRPLSSTNLPSFTIVKNRVYQKSRHDDVGWENCFSCCFSILSFVDTRPDLPYIKLHTWKNNQHDTHLPALKFFTGAMFVLGTVLSVNEHGNRKWTFWRCISYWK